MKRKFQKTPLITFGIIFIAVLFSIHLKIHPEKLLQGFQNLKILASDAFPPDISILNVALQGILETIEIAFLGTFFGTIISLPLAVLASRNLFSKKITIPIRILLAGIRSLPSLLWAIIFVIMVGLGPIAGVLATSMYTAGYLSKLQYESIEGINAEPLEALSGIGTKKLQLIRFVILPEAANNLISQTLFMFEYNIRSSSILGFVGAGGIGFYIMGYIKLLEYNKILTLLLIILATILIIDFLSSKLRDRFLTKTKGLL